MDTVALGKASKYLLLLAFSVLVCGLLRTTFGGACSESGFYISATAAAIGVLACIALFARSLRLRTSEAWMQFGCGIIAIVFFGFVALLWTLLMCRGV